MKSIWLIQSETNIHVGSENISVAGLIDKAIQRDALTKIPCINASSLKGAMNEYASVVAKMESEDRIKIFGVDKCDKTKPTQKGGYSFFDAQLLLLPVQADNCLYRLVTSKEQIENFLLLLNRLGINYDYTSFLQKLREIDNHFNPDKDVVEHGVFEDFCSDDELPIIARNKLDNGLSANLWYEQVLPQKTLFGMVIISSIEELNEDKPEGEEPKEGAGTNDILQDCFNSKIVQIGANATIGYGYCRFIKI